MIKDLRIWSIQITFSQGAKESLALEDRAYISGPDPLASSASKKISFLFFHPRNMDVILSTVRLIDYTYAGLLFRTI